VGAFDVSYDYERKAMAFWARQLNQRGFVTARSGNLSLKADHEKILITSHDSYLGFLEEDEILLTDLDANVIEGDLPPAVEKALHMGIYRRLNEVKAVIHAHPPFTTAYFNYFTALDDFSFESKFYMGQIQIVPQYTPTVTDVEPVISALEKSAIVVLQNHGVVSIGQDFKAAYGLVELLEEQAKVNFAVRAAHIPPQQAVKKHEPLMGDQRRSQKTHKLLSEAHIQYLMELINHDKEAQALGKKYGLTCTLAVKNLDSDQLVRFHYENGRITKMDRIEDAEFIITGKEDVLKRIFNSEMDPFVAATQGKVKTQGDFSRMSMWYPALVRTFKLWENAPVE